MGDSCDASSVRQPHAMPLLGEAAAVGAAPALRQPPATGQNGWSAANRTGSPPGSDEDEEMEDLPQTASAHGLHTKRYKLLSSRFYDLQQETVSLKSQVLQRGRKLNELHVQREQEIKEVQRNDSQLTARVEALDAENVELKQRSLQFSAEHEQIEERLQEYKTQHSETENRIQRLMDRLVTLLSNTSGTETMRTQFAQELEESVQLYERRCDSQKAQLVQAKKDNRKAALQLSDEQRRTKRLHDHLCHKQSLLFNRHERALPAGGEAPQASAAMASDSTAAGSKASSSDTLPRQEGSLNEPLPSTLERVREEKNSNETEEATSGSSAALEQVLATASTPPQRPISLDSSSELHVALEENGPAAYVGKESGSDTSAPEAAEKRPQRSMENEKKQWPGAAAPQASQAVPAAAPEAGAGPNVEDTRPLMPTAREEASEELTDAGLSTPPPTQQRLVAPTRERMQAMEARLCDVLDAMQFENLVVRLGNGLYQFGRSWRAHVRLNEKDEVFASVDDSDYEPIRNFIVRISKQDPLLDGSAVTPSVLPEAAVPSNAATLAPTASNDGRSSAEQELPAEAIAAIMASEQGVEQEQAEATGSRGSQERSASSVPTDPAATAAAAARQMCAQMLDPTWTSPRFKSSSGAQSPPLEDGDANVQSTGSSGERRERQARPVLSSGQVPFQKGLLVGGAALATGLTGPGGLPRGTRAWSPTPPRTTATIGASTSSGTRPRASWKVHAGDDAAGHAVPLSADPPFKEPPRSPPPSGSRAPGRSVVVHSALNVPGDGRGGGDVAGGTATRPRVEKRVCAPLPGPASTAPTVLGRSPPRRAVSPDEGVQSRVSLTSGAASGSAASNNGGSGPLAMGAGSNYGSGNYGSGNYGSGSYPHPSSGSFVAPSKAKSPCRTTVVGAPTARASPPRTTTPRAAQWKSASAQSVVQPSQPRIVMPSAVSSSSLPASTLMQEAGSASVGGLSSWPSPPPRATSPLSLGHRSAGNTKTWHHLITTTANSSAVVGATDGAVRGASAPRMASSPLRGISLSSGSGQYWR